MGAAELRGAVGPMIHRLLTWTLLILAPKAVEGRFLASVLASMAVGRCGQPTSKPWDEPPSLSDAQDGLGMTVVAVAAEEVDPLIQVITISSIRSNRRFIDQSRSSKLCTRGRKCLGPGTWHRVGAAAPSRAGRTCQASRTCRADCAWLMWHVGSFPP
jgi:hypothetical protein